MAERRDYVAIDWVLGEISVTIKQACEALEAYVADPADSTRLRFCLSYTHQIQGTLQMLEFHGAAQLAEEMELLAKAMVDGELADQSRGVEALIASLLQLPSYLERARIARRDLPSVLLPIINELRALRGDNPLPEAVLFSPHMAAAKPVLEVQPELSDEDFSQRIQNLRQMFQVAFVGIIRNHQLDQNLDYLEKVCQRLYVLSQGKAREPLWKITLAVVDGLSSKTIEPNMAVKSLLKEIDNEIKHLLKEGVSYLDQVPAQQLMKNLLYYVASSNSGSPLITSVQQDYQLKEALAQSSSAGVGVADASAMRSVVEALVDELAIVKQALDLYVRGNGQAEATLTQCMPVLKRVGDTLAVLGLTDVSSLVVAQAASLQQIIGGDEVKDVAAMLLDVASQIIKIEDLLLQQPSRGEERVDLCVQPHVDEAHRMVAQESRIVLDRVKEFIIEFVASQWQHSILESVPELLSGIRGSLFLVDFVDAARVLWACEWYLQETFTQKLVPDWQALDTLADALSSVDYYLERYLEDSAGSHEEILRMALETVADLGFPLAEFDAQQSPDTSQGGVDLLAQDDVACGVTSLPVIGREQNADQSAVVELVDIAELAPAPNLLETETTAVAVVEEADSVASPGQVTDIAPVSGEIPGLVPPVPLEVIVEEVLDPDIAEIFEEEAAEVLETIRSELPKWQSDIADGEALAELRRAWHTLKGSGRMVGATVVGELAWAVESLLNKMIDGGLPATTCHVALIERVTMLVPGLVSAFVKTEGVNKAYVEQVVDTVQQFSSAVTDSACLLASIDPAWTDPARVDEAVATVLAVTPAQSSEPDSGGSVTESGAANAVAEHSARSDESDSDASESAELWCIFRAEAATHLNVLVTFNQEASQRLDQMPVSDALQRALHTLKGSANMAGQLALAEIVTPLEKLVKSLQLSGTPVSSQMLAIFSRVATWIDQRLGAGAEDDKTEVDSPAYVGLIEEILALSRIHGSIKTEQTNEEQVLLEAVGQFMLNAADHLQELISYLMALSTEDDVHGPSQGEGAATAAVAVVQHCAPIGSAADQLGLTNIADLAQACEQAAARIAPAHLCAEAIDLMLRACSGIEEMLDCLAADQAVQAAEPTLLEALAALQRTSAEADSASSDTQTEAQEHTASDDEQPALNGVESPLDGEVIDPEVLEIFVEEARDLLENLDDTIHRWHRDRADNSLLDLLKRQLHTLKGSARLVGLVGLGDWSHDYETFVSAVEQRGEVFDDAFFAQVQRYQDGVIARVEQVISLAETAPGVEPAVHAEPIFTEHAPAASVEISDEPLIDIVKVVKQESVQTPPPADSGRQDQQAVKVPSQLLEDLVNLAGETSINRGRVDEQINEVAYSLAEMDATIDRMQEQLRRLDRETEAQLMFRQEKVESLGLEEFDPLEMDRYSALQQLSRSLMESSYDVQEVKRSIFNKTRDIETLLAQQSRVNTDLQEGLMRTRMVPFMRLVPRLRRIVRQVGRELDKDISLVVNNADGEMDRTILERMVPPFEHMLRNAADHGIESREERRALEKPDTASIVISFEREAGDIVITLSDDGRGINLAAVKAKAVERGMVNADAHLPDHDILQFILQPGFSTAQSVTQLSGRGVGMDVVSSEIKQLGGSVRIESTLGQGTSFIIRLPFTVSVNRALMVQICGESYALPLNTIEGIVRVSPFELESYYQPDAPQFEYAGQAYRLRYMGMMLGRRRLPDLSSETSPLPVILVRSGDHSVAVQVDCLLGSREIVVKTLGPQFNAVQGLSGATVLGDGGVVVILDLHAMMRSDLSQDLCSDDDSHQGAGETLREQRNRLVMVVDDSVTVRKVTSRFLERNGMDVLLAKDGVDAIRLLQEHTPDVMLLDIEMPRMDGFEVASRVKHNHRLEHLPIIMITSRTGQKHRERAEAIGVDRYLGKPYQEMELLRNIDELIGVTHQRAS